MKKLPFHPAAFFLGGLLLLSLLAPSCVGKKKFLYEVAQRDSMVMQMNGRILELNREIARNELSLAEKSGETRAQRTMLDKQENKINQLEDQVEALTNKSLTQQQLMDLAIRKKSEEVAQKEQVIKSLQHAISLRDSAMQSLLGNIQAALQQYNSDDLSLEVKDGKVYVGLSEKLLFKSGSAALGKEAMGVLGKIAAVLNTHPELSIIVEGHTDNVPVKSKEFKDNWDLSVMRATTVVRILTKDFELNPSQVLAAGKGDYQPKTSNETPEGRAKNRRTEIILAPQLDAVMRLIRANSGN